MRRFSFAAGKSRSLLECLCLQSGMFFHFQQDTTSIDLDGMVKAIKTSRKMESRLLPLLIEAC